MTTKPLFPQTNEAMLEAHLRLGGEVKLVPHEMDIVVEGGPQPVLFGRIRRYRRKGWGCRLFAVSLDRTFRFASVPKLRMISWGLKAARFESLCILLKHRLVFACKVAWRPKPKPGDDGFGMFLLPLGHLTQPAPAALVPVPPKKP